jgi:adhesin/invasin
VRTTAAGVTTPVVLTSVAVAGPAATLAASAGDAQTAAVGTAVGTAPAVRVTDQYGNPVAGTAVTFAAAAAGNGTVAAATQTTNANGVATVGGWTLGSVVGTQRLTATAGALAATFTATATVSGTPTAQVQGGSGQSALVGTSVATPPSVIVRDASGRALAGVTVTFTASGDGVVTDGTQTTNVDGIATVGGWRLATASGANVLTATVTGVGTGSASAQVFATGTAGAAARVVIRQQPVYVAQSTRQVVAQVQLEDAAGNVVSGTPATVVATVASGPGTISAGGSAATESASGIAVVGITLSAPGTYTFTFSVPAQPGLGATPVSASVTVP